MKKQLIVLASLLTVSSCTEMDVEFSGKLDANISSLSSSTDVVSIVPDEDEIGVDSCDPDKVLSCVIENGEGTMYPICNGTIFVGYTSCEVKSCIENYISNTNASQCVGDMTRDYPSIFQAWSRAENLVGLTMAQNIAKHDLAFLPISRLNLKWKLDDSIQFIGESSTLIDINGSERLLAAKALIQEIKIENPKTRILIELRYRGAKYSSKIDTNNPYNNGHYHPDSALWPKDQNGLPYFGWGEDLNGNGMYEINEIATSILDFRNDSLIDTVAAKAKALADSGLIDGIMLDWFKPGITSWIRDIYGNYTGQHLYSRLEEEEGRLRLIREIRRVTPKDFLIIGNGNFEKQDIFAEYLNGSFMELHKDAGGDYSQAKLRKMEDSLYYNETHLREPRINGFEFWRKSYPNEIIPILSRYTPENLRLMRLGLTLSLTHSNGYYLFADPNQLIAPDHLHNWYDIYDVDLGTPSQKRVKAVNGQSMREYSNGYAVYNSQDAPYTVIFNQPVKDVVTGDVNIIHTVDPTDGAIFLKNF